LLSAIFTHAAHAGAVTAIINKARIKRMSPPLFLPLSSTATAAQAVGEIDPAGLDSDAKLPALRIRV